MNKLLLLSVLVFLGLSVVEVQAGMRKIPSETGNHCVDQAFGHLRHLFGEDIKMKKALTDGCSTCNNYDWIKTNICSGYFVSSYNGTASCSSAHYGFVPLYVKRIWAYGDCKKFLPRDSYLTKENTYPYIRNGQN